MNCGGTLSYSGKNDDSFIFSENITYGGGTKEGDCMLGLSIRFTLINATMNWEEIDSKGTVLAFGTLTRDCFSECKQRLNDKITICDDLFNSSGSAHYHNTAWHNECLSNARTEYDNCLSLCQ